MKSAPFAAARRAARSPPSQYVITMHRLSFPLAKKESLKATMFGCARRCMSSTSLRHDSRSLTGMPFTLITCAGDGELAREQ